MPQVPVATEYRVPRTVMARLAMMEYLRRFWWFALVPPVFGVLALSSGWQGMLLPGFIALLWPFTIPARAVLATWKAGKFFERGVLVYLQDGKLMFVGTQGAKGMRLDLNSITSVGETARYLLLRFRHMGFVPIDRAALVIDPDELTA